MPNLSSILPPNNIVTSENEATLTNKTLTDPIIQYVAGDTSFTVPAGTTGERPSSPETGELRFNTDEGSLEQYDGTNWGAVVPDDLDINTLSINGTQVVDSSGNIDTSSVSINGTTVIDDNRNVVNIDGLTVPSGTTAERPSSPSVGELRYNTDNSVLERYDGSIWVPDLTDAPSDGNQYARQDGSWTQVAGGLEENFVATGQISSGSAVGLRSDGTVELIQETTETYTESLGSEQVGVTRDSFKAISSATDFLNNRVILSYGTNTDEVIMRVGEISGSSISFGTETIIDSSADNPYVTYDEVNEQAVFFCKSFTFSGYVAYICDISGNSITNVGTAQTIDNSASHTGSTVVYDRKNNVFIGSSQDSSTYEGVAFVCESDGSSITSGSLFVFRTGNNVSYPVPSTVTQNNEFLFVYQYSGVGGAATLASVSPSDLSLTVSDDANFGDAGEPEVAYSPVTDSFLIAGNAGDGFVYEASISNGSLSSSSAVKFSTDTIQEDQVSIIYNDFADTFLVGFMYSGVNNDDIDIRTINLTSSGISSATFGTRINISIAGSSENNRHLDLSNIHGSNKAIIYYDLEDANSSDATDRARVYEFDAVEVTSNAELFLGFSKSSALNTESVPVTLKGGVVTGQSNLTPNDSIYLSDDGSLLTSDNGRKIGRAITPTKILLKGE